MTFISCVTRHVEEIGESQRTSSRTWTEATSAQSEVWSPIVNSLRISSICLLKSQKRSLLFLGGEWCRVVAVLLICGFSLPPLGRAEELTNIENGHVRLQFSSSNGGLKSFIDLKSGDNYLKGQLGSEPPFSVVLGNANGTEQVEAYPANVVVTTHGNTALIRSDALRSPTGLLPVSAELFIQLTPGSSESRWTIQVSNKTRNKTLFTVAVPRIFGVRIGTTSEDDALYFPFWGGERFPHAVRDLAAIGDRTLAGIEMGTPRVSKVNGEYVHKLFYAGGASMMWMDYLDSTHGLYIASCDPEFRVTELRAETRGPASDSMSFEFAKWVMVGPGQTWTSAPYVVAAHSGDWHWAADQYRAWFHTQVPLTIAGGAWREITGGWLAFMKNAYGRIQFKFSDLAQMWQEEKQSGMDLLIPYGWSLGGFDNLDPEFYPDLDLGTPMEMSGAYQKIRQDGGHVMTYLNGRIFNIDSIYFKTLGERWAARQPDGSLRIETYKPGSPKSFAVMCPGYSEWRNLLAGFGEMAVQGYGADLIYYDQVAAAQPVECYGSGLDSGLWNHNYVQLLQQASTAVRRHNADVALMIEGAGDLYTQFATFQSYLAPLQGGDRFGFPELYKYTFPEAIEASLILSTKDSSTSLYPVFPAVSHEIAERWLCRDIMNGNLVAFTDVLFDDQPWWSEVQQLLALRRAAAPWSGRGVFRDTADVRSADPGLEVKTFRWDHDGGHSTLVEIFNPDKANKKRVSVDCGALADVRGFVLGANGTKTDLQVSLKRGQASFEAPAALLSMTVIEEIQRQ